MVKEFNNGLIVLEKTKTKLNNTIQLLTNSTIFQPFNNLTVLIIGVFHGDEPQGKYLIERYLSQKIYPQKEGNNNLIFIPCLNPDGMQNNTRINANTVDLNRNFPAKNWGQDGSDAGENPKDYYGGKAPASEIETQFVIDIIGKYKPKIILTLHAPYKIVNYDGPAQDIAQKISEIINYPVEPSIGYPTPGSFGTYCGVERNIPTITLELDEKIPVENLVQPVFETFDILKNYN
jgi:protein MpaA